MKKIFTAKKAVAVITGAVLVLGVILTGNYGLSDEDKGCYEDAASLQKDVDEIGFEDFKLEDYLVAFCDGSHDYVIVPEGGSYSIHKRKPVIDTFVATAYEVDGHYEVIMPTKDMMGRFMNAMGGMEGAVTGNAEASDNEDEYGEEQVTTLWHEAFHCWQLTRFGDNIPGLNAGHGFDEEGYGEELIVNQCDNNSEAVELFKKETGLLLEAAGTDDAGKISSCMLQYRECEQQRDALLSETVQGLEDYYTSVEGSARYVEAMVCRLQDRERFLSHHMESINVYVNGASKYYTAGMAQCMILDKLDSTWKKHYDFSEPLISLIYRELNL